MGKKQEKQQHIPGKLEVFVSGIPYECTEEKLQQFFGKKGLESIKLPTYQDTGRCRGYAHVVFSNQDAFQSALNKNGEYLGERYLAINQARGIKKPDVENVKIPIGCKVMFVKNLPYQITEQELRREFGTCGTITDVRMVRNWANKKFKGFAYIDFSESGSLKKAIKQFHGKSFQGRTLVCDAVLSTMKKGFKKRDPYYEQ